MFKTRNAEAGRTVSHAVRLEAVSKVYGRGAGAAVLGLGASELPTRNLLRRDPAEVIGAQQ